MIRSRLTFEKKNSEWLNPLAKGEKKNIIDFIKTVITHATQNPLK